MIVCAANYTTDFDLRTSERDLRAVCVIFLYQRAVYRNGCIHSRGVRTAIYTPESR